MAGMGNWGMERVRSAMPLQPTIYTGNSFLMPDRGMWGPGAGARAVTPNPIQISFAPPPAPSAPWATGAGMQLPAGPTSPFPQRGGQLARYTPPSGTTGTLNTGTAPTTGSSRYLPAIIEKSPGITPPTASTRMKLLSALKNPNTWKRVGRQFGIGMAGATAASLLGQLIPENQPYSQRAQGAVEGASRGLLAGGAFGPVGMAAGAGLFGAAGAAPEFFTPIDAFDNQLANIAATRAVTGPTSPASTLSLLGQAGSMIGDWLTGGDDDGPSDEELAAAEAEANAPATPVERTNTTIDTVLTGLGADDEYIQRSQDQYQLSLVMNGLTDADIAQLPTELEEGETGMTQQQARQLQLQLGGQVLNSVVVQYDLDRQRENYLADIAATQAWMEPFLRDQLANAQFYANQVGAAGGAMAEGVHNEGLAAAIGGMAAAYPAEVAQQNAMAMQMAAAAPTAHMERVLGAYENQISTLEAQLQAEAAGSGFLMAPMPDNPMAPTAPGMQPQVAMNAPMNAVDPRGPMETSPSRVPAIPPPPLQTPTSPVAPPPGTTEPTIGMPGDVPPGVLPGGPPQSPTPTSPTASPTGTTTPPGTAPSTVNDITPIVTMARGDLGPAPSRGDILIWARENGVFGVQLEMLLGEFGFLTE